MLALCVGTSLGKPLILSGANSLAKEQMYDLPLSSNTEAHSSQYSENPSQISLLPSTIQSSVLEHNEGCAMQLFVQLRNQNRKGGWEGTEHRRTDLKTHIKKERKIQYKTRAIRSVVCLSGWLGGWGVGGWGSY